MSSSSASLLKVHEGILDTIHESLLDHIDYVEKCHEDAVQTIESLSKLWSQLSEQVSQDTTNSKVKTTLQALVEEMGGLMPTLEAFPEEVKSMVSELTLIEEAIQHVQQQSPPAKKQKKMKKE